MPPVVQLKKGNPIANPSAGWPARPSARVTPVHMLRNLWRHRELIQQLVNRELGLRYRGSYLGMIWSILVPLSTLLVYTFVFSVVFQARWDVARDITLGEYGLILLAGLAPYAVFSEVVNHAPGLVLNVPNYVRKVVFPLEILPVVSVVSALINSLISLGILLAVRLIFFRAMSSTVGLLPLAYLPLVLLCLGLSWFLASLGVYLRDLRQGISVVVQILFFMSPVLYPVTRVPEPLRVWMYFNPLTTILNGFRETLLWGEVWPWGQWALWTFLAAVVAWLGYAWFIKTKKGFADVM